MDHLRHVFCSDFAGKQCSKREVERQFFAVENNANQLPGITIVETDYLPGSYFVTGSGNFCNWYMVVSVDGIASFKHPLRYLWVIGGNYNGRLVRGKLCHLHRGICPNAGAGKRIWRS